MLVINDLHVGVQRKGGTTPQTQQALRNYIRHGLQWLLDNEDHEIAVNGDLFDAFTVDIVEVMKTYDIFAEWLEGGVRTLNMIQGNHDANPRGDKVSSFHLLCHFLKARFGNAVNVLDSGFAEIGFNPCDNGAVFCIPHMPNQDMFNIEVEKAINSVRVGSITYYLLLHCNYKNTFAEHADHSLNLSDDQVGRLIMAGWNLVIAHEHVGYELRSGRVRVVGNQVPSSVSDCIGDDEKNALTIKDGVATYLPTWRSKGSFAEIDWRELDDADEGLKFIRVVGECTAEQSAEMVNAVATLRQKHGAFVISNAAKVDGLAAIEDGVADSLENLATFNVMDELAEVLTSEELDKVKALMGDSQ